jgi:hypothetical protein
VIIAEATPEAPGHEGEAPLEPTSRLGLPSDDNPNGSDDRQLLSRTSRCRFAPFLSHFR